jgi:hypothetical protein
MVSRSARSFGVGDGQTVSYVFAFTSLLVATPSLFSSSICKMITAVHSKRDKKFWVWLANEWKESGTVNQGSVEDAEKFLRGRNEVDQQNNGNNIRKLRLYLQEIESRQNEQPPPLKTCRFPDIEKRLKAWAMTQHSLSYAKLRRQAIKIRDELSVEHWGTYGRHPPWRHFKASCAWILNFLQNHQINLLISRELRMFPPDSSHELHDLFVNKINCWTVN